MKGDVKSLKEKCMNAVKATFLSLGNLLYWVLAHWSAVYCRTNVVSLWGTAWFWPLDAMFLLLEKIGLGCAPSSMPWLSDLYTERKPSCSNTSPGLWEAVPREGTLQFRQNQRRFWWLSDVERKPQNVLLFFWTVITHTPLVFFGDFFFLLYLHHSGIYINIENIACSSAGTDSVAQTFGLWYGTKLLTTILIASTTLQKHCPVIMVREVFIYL